MPARRRRTITHPRYHLASRFNLFWNFIIRPRPRLNSVLTTLLSIAGLIISLIGLNIAVDTYREQQLSGPKQQAAIDSSRASLEAVRRILDNSAKSFNQASSNQQKLLDSNVLVASQQLSILNAQRKDQLRKPDFDIEFQYSLIPLPQKIQTPYGEIVVEPATYGDTDFGRWLTLNDDSKSIAEDQLKKNTLIIPVSRTVNDTVKNVRYFKIISHIKNNGYVNATNIRVNAFNNNRDNIVIEGGAVRDRLLIHNNTGEQMDVAFKIYFWFHEEMLNRVFEVNVSVYAENVSIHVVPIRFKIVS